MTRTFVELPFFQRKWKDLGLTDTDLKRLQKELLSDPKVGAVMQGTGGIRKMRFAFEKRGKAAVSELFMWILRFTRKYS